MLRAIERRWERVAAIAAVGLAFAAAAGPVAAAPAAGAASAAGAEYEKRAELRVEGLERDRRFGRAWLIADLTGQGHLRTISSRVKAFAPAGELDPGLIRIPLIPRLPVAKKLRREGHAAVTVTIDFRPTGKPRPETLRRKVILTRSRPERSPHPLP